LITISTLKLIAHGYRTIQTPQTPTEKIIETSNQPIRTNIFPKKIYLVPQKWQGVQNSYGGYPTEFAGSTQNPKKNYRNTKSNQIENFLKKTKFRTLKV
jgi:hypothetical protein